MHVDWFQIIENIEIHCNISYSRASNDEISLISKVAVLSYKIIRMTNVGIFTRSPVLLLLGTLNLDNTHTHKNLV